MSTLVQIAGALLLVVPFAIAAIVGWRRHRCAEAQEKRDRRNAFRAALLELDAIASRSKYPEDREYAKTLTRMLCEIYDTERRTGRPEKERPR